MSDAKDPIEYMRHIKDECAFILSVAGEGLTRDGFMEDETLKRAVVRSLEITREATKKIPADVKLKWDTVSWKHMAGMRDRLIHDYMGVDYSIVWDVVRNRIPQLTQQIEDIIDKERS